MAQHLVLIPPAGVAASSRVELEDAARAELRTWKLRRFLGGAKRLVLGETGKNYKVSGAPKKDL